MIKAEIIAHSKNEFEDELITFVVTFPRIILAELNTHRAFSRNSASSRAIPFNKMLESVQNNPFIPIAWQKEHKGMQGAEYFEGGNIQHHISLWLQAKDNAIIVATKMADDKLWPDRNLTKQLANRLLEPFMWHTAIITTGKEGLNNFFDLRCPQYDLGDGEIHKSRRDALNYAVNKGLETLDGLFITELDWLLANKGQAEIHMMALAEAMYDAYNESTPELLKGGEWHIIYKKEILEQFREEAFMTNTAIKDVPDAALIGSVMGARVSYTVAGHELSEWTPEKYINKAMELANAKPLHASPFEHCAQNMGDDVKWYGRFTPSKDKDQFVPIDYDNGWCRNYKGFIQLRHILETK